MSHNGSDRREEKEMEWKRNGMETKNGKERKERKEKKMERKGENRKRKERAGKFENTKQERIWKRWNEKISNAGKENILPCCGVNIFNESCISLCNIR